MKFVTGELQKMGDVLMLKYPIGMEDEIDRMIGYAGKGKRVTVEFKRERRSKDANSYCWVLCSMLADRLSTPRSQMTKEEVYRHAIRECGHFTVVPIKREAVNAWKRIWSGNGTGWIAEELGESKLDGYVKVAAYHGSSVYDSKEMSRLIDYLIEECKSMGIETEPREYLDGLLMDWRVQHDEEK